MLQKLKTTKSIIKKKLLENFNPKYKLNYQNNGQLGFIDVGSIGGLPKPWRQNANQVSFLLNFEPNDKPSRTVNSMTYNTAVWESEATLPFYIYKGLNATGSSLFKQNFEYVKKNLTDLEKRGPKFLAETWFDRSQLVDTIEIKCKTIDSILKEELPSTPFHFMKIDAQGAEYNILQGSKEFLSGSCIGLHLELFVLPLYKDIFLLDQVEEFLKEFNFQLVKKFPSHGSFDSQHDCLFLKKNGDQNLTGLIKKIYDLS